MATGLSKRKEEGRGGDGADGLQGKIQGEGKGRGKPGLPGSVDLGSRGGSKGKSRGGKKGAWTAGTSWERGSGSREEIRVSSSGNGPPSPEP